MKIQKTIMQIATVKKIKVLMVDDDFDDYFLTNETLSEIDGIIYEVVWHSVADDVKALFQRDQFDVALVDFQVGEWNGIDLIKEAVAVGFDAPIILLTGLQERAIDIAAADAGAADYLCKSQLTPEVLERSIRYAISNAEMRREMVATSKILRTTLDNAGVGIGNFDKTGNLISCNARFLHSLGLSGEINKSNDFLISDPASLIRLSECVNDRISSASRSERSESLYLTSDDSVLEIQQNEIDDGGVVMICVDITERVETENFLRSAQNSAEEASRAKSAFLASMSHELRTPLNSIIGFSELLKQQFSGTETYAQYTEFVENILNSGNDLLCIVNDILDLAKCESGTVELNLSRVPIGEIVMPVMSQLAPLANKADVTLDVDISDKSVRLKVDETRVRQIIRNLISNAIKFTPCGGTVRLSTSLSADNEFVLEISDTGIGISAEDLSRIREPFQQVDSNLSRKYEGTGLGIPICCAMAHLHGGEIEYESEIEKGTTVRLTLPASIIVGA